MSIEEQREKVIESILEGIKESKVDLGIVSGENQDINKIQEHE